LGRRQSPADLVVGVSAKISGRPWSALLAVLVRDFLREPAFPVATRFRHADKPRCWPPRAPARRTRRALDPIGRYPQPSGFPGGTSATIRPPRAIALRPATGKNDAGREGPCFTRTLDRGPGRRTLWSLGRTVTECRGRRSSDTALAAGPSRIRRTGDSPYDAARSRRRNDPHRDPGPRRTRSTPTRAGFPYDDLDPD